MTQHVLQCSKDYCVSEVQATVLCYNPAQKKWEMLSYIYYHERLSSRRGRISMEQIVIVSQILWSEYSTKRKQGMVWMI